MTQSKEIYRTAFLTHLQKAHVGEEYECVQIVQFAETELNDFIKREVRDDFPGLYALRDIDFYKKLRSLLQIPGNLKTLNDQTNGLYSQALRRYIDFLESSWNPDKPKIRVEKTQKKQKVREEDELLSMVEGEQTEIVLTKYERNPELRKLCLDHYGYRCQVCGIDLEKVYGELGHEYIEVHHLRPISTFKHSHLVDPIHDLVPLCANCHAMIHRGKERVLTLNELKSIYSGFKY